MRRKIGIRALKQNASAVVSEVASGEPVTITDRGRPVAQIVPLAASPLERMIDTGEAVPAQRSILDLPEPAAHSSLSAVLNEMRQEERY